jgi:hypothetical protein
MEAVKNLRQSLQMERVTKKINMKNRRRNLARKFHLLHAILNARFFD